MFFDPLCHVNWCISLHSTKDREIRTVPHLSDQAKRSRWITSEWIQRSNIFVSTEVTYTCRHNSVASTSLSSATLSPHRSPNSGHLKTPDYHINVPLLLARKPQAVFVAEYRGSGRNKAVKSLANRSFKPSILSHQPLTTSTTTIIRILSSRSSRNCPL
jgi:hypothetical protein